MGPSAVMLPTRINRLKAFVCMLQKEHVRRKRSYGTKSRDIGRSHSNKCRMKSAHRVVPRHRQRGASPVSMLAAAHAEAHAHVDGTRRFGCVDPTRPTRRVTRRARHAASPAGRDTPRHPPGATRSTPRHPAGATRPTRATRRHVDPTRPTAEAPTGGEPATRPTRPTRPTRRRVDPTRPTTAAPPTGVDTPDTSDMPDTSPRRADTSDGRRFQDGLIPRCRSVGATGSTGPTRRKTLSYTPRRVAPCLGSRQPGSSMTLTLAWPRRAHSILVYG